LSKIWVIDAEGDGLNPTKLHCLAASNPQTSKVFVTPDYENMKKILVEADVLICHNIIRFDKPVFERLLGIKIKAKLVDTLALSWYLYPERNKHGLESWGIDFGVPKPFIQDWSTQTSEEYQHRCKEDVKINVLLWNKMYRYLMDIYGSDKAIWKLLDYIEFKMHCAALQEKSRWKLDVEYVQKSLDELTEIQEEKTVALALVMPKVPVIQIKTKPKRFINANGDYSKLGMDWIALLTERGLPVTYEGEIEIVKGYEDANPSSPVQRKDWLYSLGWVPETFKETKNKLTGETKSIPQINLEHGKGICPSIKKMYDKEPSLELLDGLSVLQHRIGILKGFLRDQEDGWIKAQVNGLTNTLRFQHTTVVNLPKVDKLYAEPVRSSLIAEEGYELCGSDMASLEDRIKQHFIYPHDPEYVKEMLSADYDPHLSLALSAEAVTLEQIMLYNSGENKSIKPIRDIFKNGNYACQYNAGAARLAITCGISVPEAAKVHKAYWKKNWAIKQVASEQRTKLVGDQMWLFNPISELWYTLRNDRDIFSTLVQGTASYVFDVWVQIVLEEREQLTGQFHDEIVLCVKGGYSTYNKETRKWEGPIVDFLKNAIRKTNEKLKLNRELDIDVQFGKRYSDIH
jgi:hypothetical protein